jgi:hypothetical protein
VTKITFNRTAWGLGLAMVSAAAAHATTYPTLLYGTTTQLPPTNPFAITTTLPTLENPRSKYVVVAEENANTDLEVLAWHDTTSSLVLAGTPGIEKEKGVAGVAVTGLDSCRVVTADVDSAGALSLHTWTVDAAGVRRLRAWHTPASTSSANVAITALSPGEVVVAYETPAGVVTVEAFTITADGRPAPKAVLGTGPSAFEVSIATVNPHQVITAAGDASQSLWTNTWRIDATGVHAQDQVETKNAVSGPAIKGPVVQTLAVGAGWSVASSGIVQSAFTPVITPDLQVQAYYWTVSNSGALTLNSTAPPTLAGDFFGVAASMLPNNIPITTYLGGIGDNSVFTEVYTGLNPFTDTPPTYGDPYNAVSIGTAPAGSNLSFLSLFDPYSAFFVSAGQFGAPEGNPDGTIFINVFSYPEPPLL